MPTNDPITQPDFETIIAPIIALLAFYSDGLLVTANPVREPREDGAPRLRFHLACNFFQRATTLDPYIFILLKANDRSDAITFWLVHHLQYEYGRFFSCSELVVSGSRDTPRAEYVAKVAQLIRNFARARDLTEHQRDGMRN